MNHKDHARQDAEVARPGGGGAGRTLRCCGGAACKWPVRAAGRNRWPDKVFVAALGVGDWDAAVGPHADSCAGGAGGRLSRAGGRGAGLSGERAGGKGVIDRHGDVHVRSKRVDSKH